MNPEDRLVKMKINACKYFYLPCKYAHQIREILDEHADSSKAALNYTISDLE